MFVTRLFESTEVRSATCYHVNVLLEVNTSGLGASGDWRSAHREPFAGTGHARKAIGGHVEGIGMCRRRIARLNAVASSRC